MYSYSCLCHTGVKGMRWGSRKAKKQYESTGDASGAKWVSRKAKKQYESTQKTATTTKQKSTKETYTKQIINKNKIVDGRTYAQDVLRSVGTVVIGSYAGKAITASGHDVVGTMISFGSLGAGIGTYASARANRKETVVVGG